mmetsp:Transcript_4719/g.7105  ORF Transcript_4719/g.7105 Transcript_4719/m.7105 type:complete len:221 (-) Transcript_4719:225-887(-)
MLPPADKEYAVEPVGVEMIIPSPWICVIGLGNFPTYKSRLTMLGLGPRSMTTSFNTVRRSETSVLSPRYIKTSSRDRKVKDISSFKSLSRAPRPQCCGNVLRKPNEPIAIDNNGGQPIGNKSDVQIIVPSPPIQMQKSIGSDLISVPLVGFTPRSFNFATKLLSSSLNTASSTTMDKPCSLHFVASSIIICRHSSSFGFLTNSTVFGVRNHLNFTSIFVR